MKSTTIRTFPASAFASEARRLIKDLDEYTVKWLIAHDIWIAGGALTSVFSGERIRDFDLYSTDKNVVDASIRHFECKDMCRKVFHSDNADTFVVKSGRTRKPLVIQVIMVPSLFGTGSMSEVLSRFDFTVCQAAFSLHKSEIMMGERFLRDLAAKRIVYNVNGLHPISSLYRLKKYMSRGFTPAGLDLIKLGLKIHTLNIPDYATLRREILGVDLIYLKPLTDHLMNPEVANKPFVMEEAIEMFEAFEDNVGMDDERGPDDTEGA